MSLAESEDAFRAVDKLGVSERETFRLSLRTTLIKNHSDLEIFDRIFPLFFSSNSSAPLMNLVEDLTPEEAQQIAQTIQNFNARLQQMLERLLQGDSLSQAELDHLAEMVGLQNANDLRYQEWMARRMEQALQFEEVRQAIQEFTQTLAQMGFDSQRLDQFDQIIQANLKSLQSQLRQFAGQRIAENLDQDTNPEGIDQLLDRPFTALSEKDMDILRLEVRRLAAVLRSKAALRQKRAKNGIIDPKATIRYNLKHGGVPFKIQHRDRHIKPKLVVICDISTSMRYCSELMLSLIYEIKDQIKKTHAFTFIDHLEYISPDFVGKRAQEAVNAVLHRMPPGYYSTDLGYSLLNFSQDYLDTIDSRTSLIMVGDGRNNFNNPQLDIFKLLARRAHRTIWINPEPQIQWGSGDSDMWKYAPYCDDILKAATLNEMKLAVDQLLY